MKNIVITGGTGLIGKHLSRKLVENNFNVTVISRKKNTGNNIKVALWNPDKNEIDTKAISSADYIIHLAGAGIGDKWWTKKRKKELLDSRVKTTELLLNTVRKSINKPEAFISSSAIGYYGAITSDRIFTENDPHANDFTGNLCKAWEETADKFASEGIRTVKIRTGIVLTAKGGALARMILPIKFFVSPALGNGRQYIPWIHIDDLCNIYIKAVTDPLIEGAYNAVAPEHKKNSEFVSSLAKSLRKPLFFPGAPSFLIKVLFGKMSEMLLTGSRVSCNKIRNAGYSFMFPDLDAALRNLFPE